MSDRMAHRGLLDQTLLFLFYDWSLPFDEGPCSMLFVKLFGMGYMISPYADKTLVKDPGTDRVSCERLGLKITSI